ncbi:gliding motility protein GldN [Flavobacteriaceae bacterium]|nr:gliding motility protein GldN [Flavobacteriaceae bacterium]
MNRLPLLLFVLPFIAFSQANILNAKSPDEIGVTSAYDEVDSDEEPLAYGFISDKDVLFSKTIWEEINLDERVNFPMYYPIDTLVVGNERRPLIHFLLKGALNGDYPVYKKDNFKDLLSIEDINRRRKYRQIRSGDSDNVIGLERINNEGGKEQFLIMNGVDVGEYANKDESLFETDEYNEYDAKMEDLIFENNLLSEEEYSEEIFGYADVAKYKIKGVWYFDKRQSDLRYRPIAIAPIVVTPKSKAIMQDINDPNVKPDYIELFWIFYPDARKILHEGLAFNDKNTSKPISFDHLINSRRFSAYIYKEDNVYEDREINDYISENSLMQLIESQRIKEKIRNLEQDMWSY